MSEEIKVNQRKLEALCAAIAKINSAFTPDGDCFFINNPLKVRSFARPGKHMITDDGLRIFPSILAGLKAGLFDLELKIKGQSRAGLKTTDELSSLLALYGIRTPEGRRSIVSFLRRALKDDTVREATLLSYFVEEPQGEVNAGQ